MQCVCTTHARNVRALQEHGPFDGLLGFSQGATLGALLCLAPPAPPVRFAVLVSGFMPRDPALEPLVGSAEGRLEHV